MFSIDDEWKDCRSLSIWIFHLSDFEDWNQKKRPKLENQYSMSNIYNNFIYVESLLQLQWRPFIARFIIANIL